MLFGQPQGYHRWDGSRFVLAPMPQGGLLASQTLEPSPELQKQAALSHSSLLGSPSSDSGGDRGMGAKSGDDSGKSPGPSSLGGSSYGSAAGLIGGLASAALGLPGIGLVANAAGTAKDVADANEKLSGWGLSPNVGFGPSFASNLTGGMLGLSAKDAVNNSYMDAFANGTFGPAASGMGLDLASQPFSYEGPMTLEPAIAGAGLGGIGAGATGALGTTADGIAAGYGALGTPSSFGMSDLGSGSDSGGSSKIACTAMCEAYGFGSFRQKIWLAQSRDLAPEYQAGYHALFLPLVDLAYRRNVRWLRRVLEHIARHRTADIWKQKRGKRDWIGAVERAILEPLCYAAGWLLRNAAGAFGSYDFWKFTRRHGD